MDDHPTEVWVWGRSVTKAHTNTPASAATETSVFGRANLVLPTKCTPFNGRNVIQVACGSDHAVALSRRGDVYSWGAGYNHQLGHGTFDEAEFHDARPIRALSLARALCGQMIVKVACGCAFSVVLTDQGSLFSWGRSSEGQAGHGSNVDEQLPRKIQALNNHRICDVACGGSHSLAVTTKGQVFSWGRDRDGRLGRAQQNQTHQNHTQQQQQLVHQSTPQIVVFGGDVHVLRVACGWSHSVAIADTGTVYVWGKGEMGQLGLGSFENVYFPRKVAALANVFVTEVSCGYYHTLFLSNDGHVFVCGGGDKGQLGLGKSVAKTCVPQLIRLPHSCARCVSISAGLFHNAIVCLPAEPGTQKQTPPSPIHRQTKQSQSQDSLQTQEALQSQESLQSQPHAQTAVLQNRRRSHASVIQNRFRSASVVTTAEHRQEMIVERCGAPPSLGVSWFRWSLRALHPILPTAVTTLPPPPTSTPPPTTTPTITDRDSPSDDDEQSVCTFAFPPRLAVAALQPALLVVWGLNANGQLGLGFDAPFQQDSPVLAQSLPSNRDIVQVVCGRDFTVGVFVASKPGCCDRTQAHYRTRPTTLPLENVADSLTTLWTAQQRGSTEDTPIDNVISELTEKWQGILSRVSDMQTLRQMSGVQNLWREGVPFCVRARLWPFALGNRLGLSVQLYKSHLQLARATLKQPNPTFYGFEESVLLIDRDMPRTLPNLEMFDQHGAFFSQLRHVLQAWTFYRPDIGYVQGMSYLAAMLLLHVDNTEQAFEAFSNLVTHHHFLALFRVDMVGFRDKVFDLFHKALFTVLPEVYNKFMEIGVTPNQFLVKWMLTVFVQYFEKLEIVSRVWDRFLLEGVHVLFEVSLGILRVCKPQLLAADDMGDCVFVFKTFPKGIDEAELFSAVDACKLDNKTIEEISNLKRRGVCEMAEFAETLQL